MIGSVLFVCTGNTCRSPLAEHFFAEICREAGLSRSAASAGTRAAEGMPLSRGAAAVLEKRGLGPAAHHARPVNTALLDAAESVYVMERAHRDQLVARFPGYAAKIALLREAAGLKPAEVEDPVGADAAEYEICAASIEEALRIIVLRENKLHAQNTR